MEKQAVDLQDVIKVLNTMAVTLERAVAGAQGQGVPSPALEFFRDLRAGIAYAAGRIDGLDQAQAVQDMEETGLYLREDAEGRWGG